jgi:hypothetical protein
MVWGSLPQEIWREFENRHVDKCLLDIRTLGEVARDRRQVTPPEAGFLARSRN